MTPLDRDILSETAPEGIDPSLHKILRTAYIETQAALLAKYPKLPVDWRERMPSADAYYRRHVRALGKPNARGWVWGRCPLHGGKRKSWAFNCSDGTDGWYCLAGCGMGDLIDLHQRLTGYAFESAVLDLLRVLK